MINVELRIYSYIMVHNSLMDGMNEEATDGGQDKKPHIAAWTVGCFASAFSDFLHIVDRRHDVRVFIFANDFSEYRTSRVQL